MTKTQFRKKIRQLKKEVNRLIDNRIEKVLDTGAIELKDWEDDFRLPKIFMSAMGREISFQFKPLSKEQQEEVDNLYKFI